jgi:AraC-like DNA-binding protein
LSVTAHCDEEGNKNDKEGTMERIGQILWISHSPSDFERPTRTLFASKGNLRVCEPVDVETPMFEGPDATQLICCAFEYVLLGELTLITALRRRYPQIPIVLITRRPSTDLALWALRTGVHDLLCSPVSERHIDHICEFVLQQREQASAQPSQRATVTPITSKIAILPHSHDARLRQLHAVRQQFESHPERDLAQEDCASQCHYSSSHFSRRFRAEFGETFARYKLTCRIDRACELLLVPGLSVSDVATLVGFTDPSYFTRIFRQRMGLTPSQFRDTGNEQKSLSHSLPPQPDQPNRVVSG